MDTRTTSRCPMHGATDPVPGPPPVAPPGTWPPGPRTGLTGWSLLRRMAADLPGALEAWKREFGDVFHLRIWPEHQVVLGDPALARELLVSHHEHLVRWERGIRVLRSFQGHSVVVAEGEAWRHKRQALQPAFTPRAVQAFAPSIAQAAAQALDAWPAGGEWPVERAFNTLAMDVIVRMLFSTPLEDDARAAEQAVHEINVEANREFYWPVTLPDAMPWKARKRRAIALLRGRIEGHLQARLAQATAQRPDDLLSRLLALHDADPARWPLQAVRDESMAIFLAGHETVAATLAWWAWCMAAHPQAQRRAAEEVARHLAGRPPRAEDLPGLPYLAQTLQETMRLYPAAPILLTRRSTEPIALGPWRFPARTMFVVPVRALHLDARWFPEPLAFRPERFGDGAPAIPRGAFMPFGAGPRVCLGQHLAMTQMLEVAALVLQRFELSPLPGQQQPTPRFHVTLRPQEPLALRVSRRR